MTSDDFRQLRRHMLCWRAADLEKNGLEGWDEGWRITGEGLHAAAALGYQVIIDGKHSGPTEVPKTDATSAIPQAITPLPSDLAPIFVTFLRDEIAILGADLAVYGPFRKGEVVAIPFVHAGIFFQNGVVLLYEG